MKKLGTLAIGTLLFFAVSCNKNKTSLPPVSETVKPSTETPVGVRNDEDIKNTNTTLKMVENGPDTKTPVRNVRNDEVVNPWTHFDRSVLVPRTRNDEQVNPNASDK